MMLIIETNYPSMTDFYFVSMLYFFNVNHFIYILNYNNVILYLVLSNTHVVITNDLDSLLPIDKHQPALTITLSCSQFDSLTV